jgi:ABC-type sugar transport system substrate-binding protein
VRVTRSKSWARGAVLAFAAIVIGLGLAACGGGGGGGGPKIALLLPESKTTRYEAHDHPEFEAALKSACSDCDLIYNNANQDASTQQSQMESALTDGADVVVLDPVDSASAASMVALAKQQNVPVVSYDRLILDTPDVAAYVSFDNVKVGELQGSTLATKLADDGNAKGRSSGSTAPRPTTTPRCSVRARPRSWTRPAFRSPRSTTPRIGARTRPSPRWIRRSPRSARPGSRVCTP